MSDETEKEMAVRQCAGIIPGTAIACGENDSFCSTACLYAAYQIAAHDERKRRRTTKTAADFEPGFARYDDEQENGLIPIVDAEGETLCWAKPDRVDAVLEMLDKDWEHAAILRDLAARDPYGKSPALGTYCTLCGGSSPTRDREGFEHEDRCVWLRARRAVGTP